MHPADIKALLEKAGHTQASIARSVRTEAGHVTSGAVHLVILGTSKSRRIARQIAIAVGMPVGQLWPGKYPDIEKLERLRSKPSSKAA